MRRFRVLLCFLYLLVHTVSSFSVPSLFIIRANKSSKKEEKNSKFSKKDSKKEEKNSKDNDGKANKHGSSSKDSSSSSSSSSKQHDASSSRRVKLIVSPVWARILYSLTAINPALAVIFNDYGKMIEPVQQVQTHHRLQAAYETIFFFARLKPRVSFAIGAILRALQLTTAFQYVFDPLAGVGFGLNSICLFAKSRWPATIVLGWSITKPMWKVLGACPPSGLPVPITVSFRKVEGGGPDLSRAGYSLGLRSKI